MQTTKSSPSNIILLAFGLLSLSATDAFSQGSLTPPPGPPAPNMKTLEQIEPRTPISSLPFTINAPGSYYVTTNLSGNNGITINADCVTLDLGGFCLNGLGVSGEGISVQGPVPRQQLVVRNGNVRGWYIGVNAFRAADSRFEDLNSSTNLILGIGTGNGCLVRHCITSLHNYLPPGEEFADGQGIVVGTNCTVIACVSRANARDEILTGPGCTVLDCTVDGTISAFAGSTIKNCTARGGSISAGAASTLSGCTSVGGSGIRVGHGSTVLGCTALNGTTGIGAGNNCVIKDCTSTSNSFVGILTGERCIISGCVATLNGSDGIQATFKCTITGNNCDDNGLNGDGAGIHVLNSDNRIEGNVVSQNDRGIDVDGAFNLVIRNQATVNNSGNYAIVPNNRVGPIVGDPATATNSWSNFDF